MQKNITNSEYPSNWDEIATATKEAAGSRCVRCGHPADKGWKVAIPPGEPSPCGDHCTHSKDDKQRILTVHHLDMTPSNCAWWNLAPLCQVCHLAVQTRYHLHQYYMLRPPVWLRPYVRGWALSRVTGLTVVNVKFSGFDQYMGRPNRSLARKNPGKDLKSVWANPFTVVREERRQDSIDRYRTHILGKIEQDPETYDLRQLVGPRIGCWCKPRACHCDVLVELVAEVIFDVALRINGVVQPG